MKFILRFGCVITLIVVAGHASASIDNSSISEQVLGKFHDAASGWADVILHYASALFWSLAGISLAWTMTEMALKKAELIEIGGEFVKFIITTSFFYWLLIHGPEFAEGIITGMRRLGAEASGLPSGFAPGNVLDIGFDIFGRITENMGTWSVSNNIAAMVFGILILAIMGLVAANMILLLCSAWILLYAGMFFLGFGGGRWTSDIAINYYKTVLSLAAQLFAMVLIIGIGLSVVDQYYSNMSQGIKLKELAIIAMVVIILFLLVDKVPSLVAGIINGSSIGAGTGLGQFGAGMAVGAAGTALAASGFAGGMMKGGARELAGGVSAVAAAVGAAAGHMSAGTGAFGGGGPGMSSPRSLGAMMDKGTKFAAQVGRELAGGTGQAMKEGLGRQIEGSKGAQVAKAIKEKGGGLGGGNE